MHKGTGRFCNSGSSGQNRLKCLVPITMLIKLPRLQQIALKNPNPKESPVHSDFCSVKALGNKIYSPPDWSYLQESTFCPRCVRLSHLTSSNQDRVYSGIHFQQYWGKLTKFIRQPSLFNTDRHVGHFSEQKGKGNNSTSSSGKTSRRWNWPSDDGKSAQSSGAWVLLTQRQQHQASSLLRAALYCRGITFYFNSISFLCEQQVSMLNVLR